MNTRARHTVLQARCSASSKSIRGKTNRKKFKKPHWSTPPPSSSYRCAAVRIMCIQIQCACVAVINIFFFFFKRDKKTFLSFLSLPYGKAAEGSLSENSSSRFNLVRSAHKSVRNSTTRRRYTCTRCGTPTCGATYWTSCAFRKSWDVYHSYNTTILRPRYSLDIIFILYYICVLFYWKPVLTWTSTSSSS